MSTDFQVMPRLTADEYAELEASIVEHGVRVPIVLSRDDRIVDGYHRDEIARKHSLHCPRVYADGDETELRGLAFSLNLHRRHLSREQKRDLVIASIKADPQLSDREHGRRTGVSKNTAASVREDLESTGQVDQSDTRVSGDGRVRPSTQPPRAESVSPDSSGAHECVDCQKRYCAQEEWLQDQDGKFHCAECVNPVCRDCDGYGCETCIPCDDAYGDSSDYVEPQLSDQATNVEAAVESAPIEDAPAKRKNPRPSLPDSFWRATYDLKKRAESVTRLAADDRFKKNKDQIADVNLSDLIRVRDALNGVIQQLEG